MSVVVPAVAPDAIPGRLDIGDSLLGAIAPERDAARRAARRLASFYLPSMPPRCRHATPSTPGPWPLVNEAFAAGDVRRALALTPDAVADRTMVAGTPDDWIEWLNTAYTSTE